MTDEELRQELFRRFDLINGEFFWKIQLFNGVFVGKKAGSYKKTGYYEVSVNKKVYQAHRLVWLWYKGCMPTKSIDHINRNPSDNRIENLREANPIEQAQNTGLKKNTKSMVKGIYYKPHLADGRWIVSIRALGKQMHLGCFACFGEALACRKEAERNFFGSFSTFNRT